MIRKIAAIALLLAASPSFALFQFSGKVENIRASAGQIIFNVCASGSETCNSFYITPNSDYAKTVVSLILAAKVSGRTVWVSGGDVPNDSWPYNGARSFSAMDLKG